jgi:Cu(I)/Ag(I) efflux system protein CusF
MKFTALILTASLAALAPWAAIAGNDTPAASATFTLGYSEAEVKKVDVEQGKVTLKHGPIDNLGMPGMTMVFRADADILSKVKPGDNVRFKADKVDGAIKVTELVAK